MRAASPRSRSPPRKYNSTIQDTPISISAFSGAQLQAAGITSVEELAHEVPGISMRSAGPGQTEYEARGLASNGGASPTVGFYLDEVALSPPALAQNGKVVIDPNLYDINRIELLRGPQGTLYGSGSMGGTVKVITNQPKLGTFEGSFQGNLSDTQGGSGNGGGNFMLNLPIGDTLALRVVGTDTYRSGWIDRDVLKNYPFYPAFPNPYSPSTRPNVLNYQIASQKTDANTEQLYGGRLSLLYKPNEDFSILTNVLYQRMQMGGYDEFDNPPRPVLCCPLRGAAEFRGGVRRGAHLQHHRECEPGFCGFDERDRVLGPTRKPGPGCRGINELFGLPGRSRQPQCAARRDLPATHGLHPGFVHGNRYQSTSEPGDSPDLARQWPHPLGRRRILQRPALDLAAVRCDSELRRTGESRRHHIRDRQPLLRDAIRPVHRRLV